MSKTLPQIAQALKDAKHVYYEKSRNKKEVDVPVQLIYAFNGTGKTRLSRQFKELLIPEVIDGNYNSLKDRVLYYNAFTEDLFYWDNVDKILNIQPNRFTEWIIKEEGEENSITSFFQYYTNSKLTPNFNEEYSKDDGNGNKVKIFANSEVTFSIETGDQDRLTNVKISKGEESCFIWSIFYSLLNQIIELLNIPEPVDRSIDEFNDLEYVFIDDPVSSLDENHLIELAVNLAKIIKKSKSELKFIITTHNPLFYNVLYNEFKDNKYKKYLLKKLDDGSYQLDKQNDDAPFSYHLLLKKEIENAILTGSISKYHFNFLRNILEKTSTFLGYTNWSELLPEKTPGERDSYSTRIMNLSSHSKHTAEEYYILNEGHKKNLEYLMKEIEIFKLFKD